ncbi:MAG: CPBP family glutamic-type intramembrane protease [Bacteriovoracia bacterium]
MNDSFFARLLAFKPIFFILLFYLIATQVAQTLLYTVVAYLVSATDKTGSDFGNTVNEISSQYLLLAFALAALLLSVTTWLADRALYRQDPFWNSPLKPAWQLDRITKRELLRGLSSGAIAVLVYLFLFTLSGQLSFLGVYITSTLGTPVFPLFFVDFAALVVLVICEEFIFRHKIQKFLLGRLPAGLAICATTAAYLFVKNLQFQLTGLDCLNLVLVNLALGFFYLKSGRSHRGLGFLLSLLCMLHPIAGLPLWETEGPSFFLFKPIGKGSELLAGLHGAPFSGLGLTSILVMIVGGAYLTWKQDVAASYARQN